MYHTPYHNQDLSKYSFLVTGGAGFIGSNIVEYLIRFNAGKVIVLDNLSTGNRKNIEPYLKNPDFSFIEGDINQFDICMEACKGVDFVSHQAALGSVPRSVKDPIASNQANVDGFLNMLVAARDNRVKRLVYASSSSVYGDSLSLPKVENRTGNPLSPYAVTKKANELYASVFAGNYGMELVGLRYFNVFGPRQSPTGPYAAAIPLFLSAVLNNQSPCIYGEGEQSRDFTFIENAVQANIKALFCQLEDRKSQVFNIAFGHQTTINQLFRYIKEIAGSDLHAVYQNERAGDIKHSLADITKASTILNYKPTVSIKQGLEITYHWFKNEYFPHLN